MYSSTEVDSPSEGGGVGTVYKQEDCSRPGVLNGSFFFFFFFFFLFAPSMQMPYYVQSPRVYSIQYLPSSFFFSSLIIIIII